MNLPNPQKYASKLISKIQVSKRVYFERFLLVEPKEMTFIAGQTVMLMVAPGVNRSMSIASVPDEKNSILLAHDVGPMGPYSKWALSAKVGDMMSFMGPLGIFVLDKESPRKNVLVATGTGIAPFYSIVKDYLTHGETKEIVLYWGLRHEEDIFWHKDFEIFARSHPNFHFKLTLSQGSDSWQGLRGHVQDHLFQEEKNLHDTDFYLCGNRNMVTDMKQKLSDAGVPIPQVKSELFY